MIELEDRTRPDLFELADPDIWSNCSIDGQRLTWRELTVKNEEELRRLRPLATLLSDLDRCEHGRHSTDNCFGCEGMSTGNEYARPGDRIGTTLDGKPIVVPEWQGLTDVRAWRS